jgi:putative transposase
VKVCPSIQREALSFREFRERDHVRVYYNKVLPHWRQKGCTYFVTFRLADSIPQSIMARWVHERACWFRARGIEIDDENVATAITKMTVSDRRELELRFVRKLNEFLDQGLVY